MSDVGNLFKKKKKKSKKDKKDKKKKKDKKNTAGDASAAGGGSSSSSKTKWTQEPQQYQSILGGLSSKLKTGKVLETTSTIETKFSEMDQNDYNQHRAQENSKKVFHKTRIKAELKAKRQSEKPAVKEEKPKVRRGPYRPPISSAAKQSKNISSLMQSASAFPTLGEPVASAAQAVAAPAGAWGQVAADEEIVKQVEAELHEEDPEVIKQRAIEAAAKRKAEEEKRNTWSPSEEDGGVNEDMDDDKIKSKVGSMVQEYLNMLGRPSEALNEAFLSIKDLRNPAKHELVCVNIFERAFETLKGDEGVRGLADLIAAMRKKIPYLLTKPQLYGAIELLDEVIDDIKIDIPQAPERYAAMKKRLVLKGVIEGGTREFIPSATFTGPREGYQFTSGAKGQGYYLIKKDGASAAKAPAAPVATRRSASSSSIFGGASPVDIEAKVRSKLASADKNGGGAAAAAADPFGGARPVSTTKPKPDPFGGARPVESKPRSDPFGGARPVESKPRSDPFGGARAVDQKPRSDPFGGARPTSTGRSALDRAFTSGAGERPRLRLSKRTKPASASEGASDSAAASKAEAPAADSSGAAEAGSGAAPAAAAPEAAATEDLKSIYGAKKKKKKKKKTGYVA